MPSASQPVQARSVPTEIVVNGTAQSVHARTLEALLSELGFESPFIGTAVNGELVRRAQRSSRTIEAGDRIEILSPMQGG